MASTEPERKAQHNFTVNDGCPVTFQETGLAHSVSNACAIACVGRTSLYEAIRSGALRAVKRGRRTLILHRDLVHWIQSLPPVAVKSIEQSNNPTARGRCPEADPIQPRGRAS